MSLDIVQRVVDFQMNFLIYQIAHVVFDLDFLICNMVQGVVGLDLGF